MPIPPFSIEGVLPPYVGSNGPGGAVEDMSPYASTVLEVAATLGASDGRKQILRGWLQHRQALRAIGFHNGFQWLDGSFVEDKEPKDLDVVTFVYRPAGIQGENAHLDLRALMVANQNLFSRDVVKQQFYLDAFFLDLNGSPEGLVNISRYYLGLFSHRRGDDLWKGMLQVRLDDVADDAAALALLGQAPPPAQQGVTP